ncbi:uncharacterized protein C3orf38 homolog [Mobula hypostoma]|uniref:uncharacterized protein C3orf38 homolog n=1 Tax=Mobula hypostoma TaxID=723540 RepID=UPI002FC2835E
MSSFSQTQRRGCSEILESLNCDNLLRLKNTVCGKFTKDELIRIILNHSQSAEELLKRRKVRREDILKYLIKQGFKLPPSSDKEQLITEALGYWSRSEQNSEPSTAETDLQFLHQTQNISQLKEMSTRSKAKDEKDSDWNGGKTKGDSKQTELIYEVMTKCLEEKFEEQWQKLSERLSAQFEQHRQSLIEDLKSITESLKSLDCEAQKHDGKISELDTKSQKTDTKVENLEKNLALTTKQL